MSSISESLAGPFAGSRTRVIGVPQAGCALVLEEWIERTAIATNIVVVSDVQLAERINEDLRFFRAARGAKSRPLLSTFFPELRSAGIGAPEDFEAACDRIAALEAIGGAADSGTTQTVIVTTPAALLQPVPDPNVLAGRTLRLKTGQHLSHQSLVAALAELDYDSEALCEAPGQFAVRGGIVDVYPITAEAPFRIDFFGDEIESISTFDPVTQRSTGKTDAMAIQPPPSGEWAESGSSGLVDHIGEEAHWLLVEPEEILIALSNMEDPRDESVPSRTWQTLLDGREGCEDRWTEISDIDLGTTDDGTSEPFMFDAEPLSTYRSLADMTILADERLLEEQSQRARFLRHLSDWNRNGEHIAIVLPRSGEKGRVLELLGEDERLKDFQPHFLEGSINEGFRISFQSGNERPTWPQLRAATGLVVVSETEIFGSKRRRQPRGRARMLVNQSQVDQMLDFSELVDGEFVVHLQHGIAVYRGATQLEMQGETREVLTLEFDNDVLLHVPLQESHLVSRYVGLTKSRPQLGRIGSGRWEKVRAAAERATLDYAARLLETQAKREHNPGFQFPPDGDWQKEFEATFTFRETPDQAKAITDVKTDMEQPDPMDRLVCGDVGYGKTEVALRAAFKAVMGGKQVAVLVPTTVLAQQHFKTFRERMSAFPVVVEMVSRFRKKSEQQRILTSLKEGRIDILIGTHRLVQSDVEFRDLGLVIIDEEQRFGVKHKEIFKTWRTNVDMFSMSATPIPRTLYLALTGARDLSVIETPPVDRRPIQTVVKAYDHKLVVEVIRKELRRGGQVFYLHNRVTTIEATAARLRELMPEVTFGVGHGQMKERELERVMLDFVDGRFQVLVCTTIIESGIDIPNCNTMIIEGADRFGLSQLYQLRGRVGRFRHQAFAYLLLHRHARILDTARKRLHAIRQHNQLGAGFRIAMRDLELRGAGNMLGAEQSGHIVGVGFELYCQLLRQSVARLKGDPAAAAIRATVSLDFVPIGKIQTGGDVSRSEDGYSVLKRDDLAGGACPPIEARIPEEYVSEFRLRVDLSRRFAMADSPEAVRVMGDDLKDRFGEPPEPVQALLLLNEIRCLAEQKGIIHVATEGNRLKLRRHSKRSDDFVMLGSRFPRLTKNTPLLRLREIIVFLNNLHA